MDFKITQFTDWKNLDVEKSGITIKMHSSPQQINHWKIIIYFWIKRKQLTENYWF